jgi:hypothetical protein
MRQFTRSQAGRRIGMFTVLTLIAATTPALAFRVPDPSAPIPTEHQMSQKFVENQPQPYAMSYADEAFQTLGVKDGRWEAFDTGSSDPLMPSLKGGIDSGGAMVRLQWRSGD